MSGLIHGSFLLESAEAAHLDCDHTADLPMVDDRTHLPAAEIAADVRWKSISLA